MWLLWMPRAAWATWSVVGSDASTGQVGGAGASCVGGLDLVVLLGAAPGVGAIHAQALINTAGRDRGVELLEAGATPDEVIDAITDPSFDSAAESRQYGVVDLLGNAAGFTGNQNGDWAGDRQGFDGTYTYSVQGNILTGPQVVERSETAFLDPKSCDLAERLMASLEAGGAPGEGDSRCTGSGIPADSAYLGVVDPAGVPVVALSVTNTAPDDPLLELRARFDAWRANNPCPPVTTPPAETTPPVDTGTAPTTGGSEPETSPPPPAGPPPATSEAGTCGCAQEGTPLGWVFPGLLVGVFGLRRARRVRDGM